MDTFILLGSGCSTTVPICGHLLRNARQDQSETTKIRKPTKPMHKKLSGSEGEPSHLSSSFYASDESGDPGAEYNSAAKYHGTVTQKILEEFLGKMQRATRCRCAEIAEGELGSKNVRGNVSCVVTVHKEGKYSNVLVDVGTSFKDSVIKYMIPNGILDLDAVMISHDHMDALASLDMLREFVTVEKDEMGEQDCCYVVKKPLAVYASNVTADGLFKRFDYCFQNPLWQVHGDGSIRMPSRWPVLDLRRHGDSVYDDLPDLEFGGLTVSLYPCYHGGRYICMGYGFSGQILYLSDIKSISKNVLHRIKTAKIAVQNGGWDYLFIDGIAPQCTHYSHNNFLESMYLGLEINPRKVIFIGMTCVLDHDKTNAQLQELLALLKSKTVDLDMNKKCRVESVQLGYDGMKFSNLNLSTAVQTT